MYEGNINNWCPHRFLSRTSAAALRKNHVTGTLVIGYPLCGLVVRKQTGNLYPSICVYVGLSIGNHKV